MGAHRQDLPAAASRDRSYTQQRQGEQGWGRGAQNRGGSRKSQTRCGTTGFTISGLVEMSDSGPLSHGFAEIPANRLGTPLPSGGFQG